MMARESAPGRLGLLGTLTSGPCLLELYSEPPTIADLRTCLSKHLIYGQQRARDAPSEGGTHRDPAAVTTDHCTWILSAGVPNQLLSELAFERAVDDPPGIYRLAGEVRRLGVSIGVVVATQLPVDRSTLLVRMMAGGALLAPAVRELAALPEDAFERVMAEPILLRIYDAIEKDTTQPPSRLEQEIMVAVQSLGRRARTQS